MTKRKKIYITRSTEFVSNALNETSVENKASKKPWWTSFSGIFLIFLSSVTFQISNLFLKKLTYISAAQLSTIQNMAVFLGILPVAIYSTKNIFGPKDQFWLLFIRSFIAGATLFLTLMSYRYLPLADASIIMATVPSLVTLASRVFLKEPCGIVHVLSLLMTALGVLLSTRLPELLQDKSRKNFNQEYIVGLASAFSCVLISTFSSVTLRKMQDVHFSVILLYFGALGTIENSILTALFSNYSWPHCDSWESIQVMLVGVFGFMGHSFMTLAFQKESAGIVATSKAAVDIIISTLFQFIFFNSVPDAYTLGGGLLIILATSFIGLYKCLMNLPEDSILKKRLKCLQL